MEICVQVKTMLISTNQSTHPNPLRPKLCHVATVLKRNIIILQRMFWRSRPLAHLAMLRSGRWWLVEGFSGLIQLSPLWEAEGPNEKIGRVEYGLEGSRIYYPKQNWEWAVLLKRQSTKINVIYNFTKLSLPFCNTVSTLACIQNQKYYSTWYHRYNWKVRVAKSCMVVNFYNKLQKLSGSSMRIY